MKLQTEFKSGKKIEITVIEDRPVITFEGIEIATLSGVGYIAGPHRWDILHTHASLQDLLNEVDKGQFSMYSLDSKTCTKEYPYLVLLNCAILPDLKSIYFRECSHVKENPFVKTEEV